MRTVLMMLCLSAALSLPGSRLEAQYTSPFGPAVSDFGGAVLKNHDWFTPADYPQSALRDKQQGRVIVSFDITAGGRATHCNVVRSSGQRSLDQAVCGPLERRARFVPAMADNAPIATKGTLSMDFWLPPPPRQ